MIRLPPRSTLTNTLFPYTTLFRSLRGETPIPCVRCNQTVKFRDLLGTARDLGADALATGHYVRRVIGPAGPELHSAADPAKDQSYFLFATTAEQLGFLRFPLGGMSKEATRREARRLGLAGQAKPDSQDLKSEKRRVGKEGVSTGRTRE